MICRVALALSLATLVSACGGAVVDDSSPARAPATSPTGSPSNGTRDGGTSTGTSGSTTPVGTNTPVGARCGTRGAPVTCGPDQYCKYPINKSGVGTCGRDDSGGTCERRQDTCVEIYAPVCGCDGKTYGNDCEASSNGVSVAHVRACGAFACGTDWCDPMHQYCDVPSPQWFNPNPQCLSLPNHCSPTASKTPTCATCFPPTPCPIGSGGNCNATCTLATSDGLPTFTLTHE